jgi:hypothetical protein
MSRSAMLVTFTSERLHDFYPRPGGYEITSLRRPDIKYKVADNVGRHCAAFPPDIIF